MKKTLSVFLTICLVLSGLFVFSIGNCTTIAYAAKNTSDEIVGSWLMMNEEDVLFQFKNDGTGVFTDCDEVVEYTYSFDEESHSLVFDGTDVYLLKNYSFSCYICGNGMIVSIAQNGENTYNSDPDIYILQRM